jgi:hypothetical protein
MDPEVRENRITFRLADQDFTCRAELPGWLIMKFAALSSEDRRGANAKALIEFFSDALEPLDYIRFEQLVTGDEYVIPMQTLGDICNWLVSEYTNRPTQQPSSSESGAGTTGTTSKESVDTTV